MQTLSTLFPYLGIFAVFPVIGLGLALTMGAVNLGFTACDWLNGR